MPNLFFPGQTDYIEKLNTLATTDSVTDGSLAASFLSLVVAGLSTFGGGMQVNAQGSAPATPTSGFTIFADASDIPGWKGENGYVVKLNATANTADRTYTLPDASGTFALLSSAQTFTAAQTVSINSASAALTLTQAGAGAALSTNGQIVSTLGTGTAPFSVVSTTQVNNLNAQYLGGATFAAPGTIGGGTPGAATFTTLTATGQASYAAGSVGAPSVKVGGEQNGMYSDGAGSLSFATSGARVVRFGTVGGTGNYLRLDANNTPLITAIAGTTNADLGLASAGNGSILLSTNRVLHTASAANYGTVTGAAAGSGPRYAVAGSDASIALGASSKGTGFIGLYNNDFGNAMLLLQPVASSVNYPELRPSATSNYIGFSAAGSDSAIGIGYTAKGAASHDFIVNSGTNFRVVSSVASAVNFYAAYGQGTGVGPLLLATGPDININSRYRTTGAGSHIFETSGGGNIGFSVIHVASVANNWSAYGAASGAGPIFYADGVNTNVQANYSLKGGGSHVFYTGSTSAVQFVVAHVASTVNWPMVSGSQTGNAITISTNGSDSNRSITITAAGTGTVNVTNPLGLQRYTVATLPAATTDRLIIVSDESGGLVPAFSDGTNWRRVTDRAIVS